MHGRCQFLNDVVKLYNSIDVYIRVQYYNDRILEKITDHFLVLRDVTESVK